MTKNYTQLSLVQRYQIQSLWVAGMTQKFISNQIAVHPSTICRELDRNTAKRGRTSGHYVAINAQRKTDQRHQDKPKQVLFSLAMKQLIVKQLTVDKWSPEFISAKGNQTGKCPFSHEWIYQWIWACKHGNKKEDAEYKQLYKHLRHGKRRRKRGNKKDNRGIILHRVSIENRPVIVNKRERIGDIEVDLMMGKNHKGALLVMTDRACLHTRLVKLQGKTSLEVKRAMIQVLAKTKYPLHTLTFDNDMAFSEHQSIGLKVAADTYFTRPYTSQDKGTVENRIGIIRRFFPKKTDLLLITKNVVKLVERKLNNRPVRKFNYLTPNEVLQQKIALIT